MINCLFLIERVDWILFSNFLLFETKVHDYKITAANFNSN